MLVNFSTLKHLILAVFETGEMVLSVLKYPLEHLSKQTEFFDHLKEGFSFKIILPVSHGTSCVS